MADPGTPITADATPAPSAADEHARVAQLVDAVRRLGDQLEETHRTLDAVVKRLTEAADACPEGSPGSHRA